MALDGTVVSALVHELNLKLKDGRITKIAQPEKDELLLTIKQSKVIESDDSEVFSTSVLSDDLKQNELSENASGTQTPNKTRTTIRSTYRLVISVNPSLPLIYLSEDNKTSPMNAPTFCMVLRKHLNNCRIISIEQPGLERVIVMSLEHLNEMGDLCQKRLYIELMGKHSNIIFCDSDNNIIDSIKHISAFVSSVREVLPGRTYFIPNTRDKLDPFALSKDEFINTCMSKPCEIINALFSTLTGFSSLIACELVYRAGLSDKNFTAELTLSEKETLYDVICGFIDDIKSASYKPQILYIKDKPKDFTVTFLSMYGDSAVDNTISSVPKAVSAGASLLVCESVSAMLSKFYSAKDSYERIRQKSANLRHITATALERNYKKYDLQMKQLKDTEKRDKFRNYGELLNAYGYSIEAEATSYECIDYHTDKPIKIPLDKDLTASENAKHYFDKYAKLKRTFEALTEQTAQTKDEITHLESVSNALDIATSEADLAVIKKELTDCGYIRFHVGDKKDKRQSAKSQPLHYISTDGFDIYVGKNNYQNDELTFKFASNSDWWFHAKGAAGSHVILKCDGKEPTDLAFEEAAALAAYYSKLKDTTKADIDYIQKKHVKKPNAAKPGFVVYYTNFSMTVTPSLNSLTEV